MTDRVLVSWVAVNNDPYERERHGGSFRLVSGVPVPGPTLTLLFDEDSPYAGTVSDVVLFFRRSPDAKGSTRESMAVQQTMEELKSRVPGLRIHQRPWEGADPTDHGQLFGFLKDQFPELRRRFAAYSGERDRRFRFDVTGAGGEARLVVDDSSVGHDDLFSVLPLGAFVARRSDSPVSVSRCA